MTSHTLHMQIIGALILKMCPLLCSL